MAVRPTYNESVFYSCFRIDSNQQIDDIFWFIIFMMLFPDCKEVIIWSRKFTISVPKQRIVLVGDEYIILVIFRLAVDSVILNIKLDVYTITPLNHNSTRSLFN